MTQTLEYRTRNCLATIETRNPALKAMISVNPHALDEARAIDAEAATAAGPNLRLIASVKDNIDTAGLRTTIGSAFYKDRVPQADAPVVSRLRRAGCVIVGKANLHEFAFGGTTQNPHHGFARNAWHHDAIPGGSSGGSGASVMSGMCDVSLGSDTGGSVRLPAAFNGVAGLRPTHGCVPNSGCYPVSAAYDTIGPLARKVADVARIHEIIAGIDAGDVCMEDRPVTSWVNEFMRGVEGLRIGVPETWCFADIDPDVLRLVRDALDVLRELGAEVRVIDMPEAPLAQEALTRMMQADAAAVHAVHLREAPGTFGADILERLRLGESVGGQEYANHLRFKEQWLHRVKSTFDMVDVIVTPTVPMTAPFASDATRTLETTRGVSRFTAAWALAGTPALSVPVGFATNGLPAAMQLIAPRWHDARVLALGAHYQAVTAHHLRQP